MSTLLWCLRIGKCASYRTVGTLALQAVLMLAAPLQAQMPPVVPPAQGEIYQDFRGARPLVPFLGLTGPDIDAVTRPEPEGLRITLPGTRTENYPVSVVSRFTLSGDFEVTGTYELLSATPPTSGYGVGVSLSVTTDPGRRKFIKIARLVLPKEGSVYKTEYWHNEPPKAYRAPSKPTDVRGGRLRLVREGEVIRCLVADGSDEAFRELLRVTFGRDDLPTMDFAVTDSGSPGNAVDARLIDLKVRSASVVRLQPSGPEPQSATIPEAMQKGWLAAAVAGGLTTLVLIGLGGWLYRRRRGRAADAADPVAEVDRPTAPEAVSEAVAFRCSGCGKSLRARTDLTGKRVNCPKCGKSVLVVGKQ